MSPIRVILTALLTVCVLATRIFGAENVGDVPTVIGNPGSQGLATRVFDAENVDEVPALIGKPVSKEVGVLEVEAEGAELESLDRQRVTLGCRLNVRFAYRGGGFGRWPRRVCVNDVRRGFRFRVNGTPGRVIAFTSFGTQRSRNSPHIFSVRGGRGGIGVGNYYFYVTSRCGPPVFRTLRVRNCGPDPSPDA